MRAFASSVLAIARRGLKNIPSDLEFEFNRPGAEAKAEIWKRLAESLEASATGRGLAATLLDYANDGGVSRLQRLLEEHVRDHGLELRTERARQQVDLLDVLKAELEAGLRAAQAERPSRDDPVVRVRELMRDLRNSRRDLVKQLPSLRSPDNVLLAPGWSLRQDVARKAADLVMAWPEWEVILSCVEDGVVVPPAAASGPGGQGPAQAQAALPQAFGDFTPAFVRTCDELRGYAEDRALEGIAQWLSGRSAATASLRQRVGALVGPQAQERLASGPLAGALTAIARTVNPALLAKDGTARAGRQSQPDRSRHAFPLRAEQLATWAAESPAGETTRHLVRVLRTRSALIDSATEYAFRCLDAVQGRVVEQMQSRYDAPETQLPDGRQQRQFIAAVLGDQAGRRESPPDPAGALAALRRPDGVAGFGG
jgi:hypothetical protein